MHSRSRSCATKQTANKHRAERVREKAARRMQRSQAHFASARRRQQSRINRWRRVFPQRFVPMNLGRFAAWWTVLASLFTGLRQPSPALRRGILRLGRGGGRQLKAEGLEDRRMLAADVTLGSQLQLSEQLTTFDSLVVSNSEGGSSTKDGALSALSGELIELATSSGAGAAGAGPGATVATSALIDLTGGEEASAGPLRIVDDSVLVDAVSTSVDDTPALIDELTALGMQVTGSFGRVVSGFLPIDELENAAALTTLQFARASMAGTNVGSVTSQADASTRADDLRAIQGVDGSGISVGVLSDSYDSGGAGSAAADIASGDLPGAGNPLGNTMPVNVLQEIVGTGSDEGRAMAQLVHDLAPGSELLFHSAFNGVGSFAQGIVDLETAGADVIVDDIIYFAEPMFQDGPIAQAVDTVVAAGASYFSSAGNNADQSWEDFGGYRNSATLGLFGNPLHDFDPGAADDPLQSFTLPVGAITLISFQWDQPFASSGGAGSASDVDAYVVGADGVSVLAASIDGNIGGDAVEVFGFFNDGSFDLDGVPGPDTTFNFAFELFSGPAPGAMKFVDFGTATGLEYSTGAATSYGHSNAAGASSVGAAFFLDTPEFGTDPPVAESFSSLGGIDILFDTAGTRLTTPEVRQNVDIVAPDGTNTTFFGTDTVFDADSDPNFFGTSAAAPHAAAVAALLLDVNGGAGTATPAQIYSALETTAIDMDTAGYDNLTGFGLIDAVAAGAVFNTPPVATDDLDAFTVEEQPSSDPAADPPVIITAATVLANDTDAEDGTPTLTAVDAVSAGGAAVSLVGGDIQYDPQGVAAFQALGVGESAPDSFDYTVADSNGVTATATVFGTVLGVNDAPVAAGDTADVTEDTLLTASGNLLANDTDVDTNDTLAVADVAGEADDTVDVAGAYGTLDWNADGSYTYTLNNSLPAVQALALGATITDTFAYTVSDGNGGTDSGTLTVTITGTNDNPDAGDDPSSTSTYSTDEDSGLGDLFGRPVTTLLDNDTDIDVGDTLEVVERTVTSFHGASVIIRANGDFEYDPRTAPALQALAAGEQILDYFDYTVTDNHGGTDVGRAFFTIFGVNDIPFPTDDDATVSEDGPAITIDVLGNDVDADIDGTSPDDELTIDSFDTTGTVGSVTLNPDGSFNYDPNGQFEHLAVGETADDTFTYRVADGSGGFATATVTVTVTGANDAPIATDGAFSTDEDNALTTETLAGLASDADASDTLTFAEATAPAKGVLTINSDGTFTYDPNGEFEYLAVGQSEDVTFEYSVTDGLESDTAEVTITVTGVNDAPVAVDDSDSTLEDTSVDVDVLANDTDVDNGATLDPASVTIVDDPSNGSVAVNPDGTITYTPDADYNGSDSFTYTVADEHGAVSNVATVAITIAAVNDAPEGVQDVYSVDEDVTLTVASPGVLSNDFDVDGDTIEVLPTLAVLPANGTVVSIDPDGSFEYQPNADFNGTDSFVYNIADGNGGFGQGLVVIHVNPVNDPPVADDDSATTLEDTPVTVDVLDGDTDIDAGDTLNPLSVMIVDAPANGVATPNPDGTVTYTPAADYNGSDSFTYKVADQDGAFSNVATVSIEVTPVNDAPVPGLNEFSTDEDTVLDTETLSATDVEGDPLEYALVAGPVDGGTVTVDPNGDFVFDPNGDFEDLAVGESEEVTFTFSVSDGVNPPVEGTATVTVYGVNDNPVANDDSYSVLEDATLTVDPAGVLTDDTDVDSDDTTLVVGEVEGLTANVGVPVVLASGAEVTLNADGSFTYDQNGAFDHLAEGEPGSDSFTYRAMDTDGGLSDLATVTIAITGVNDAPVAEDDTASANEDELTPIITLLDNDTDIDGDQADLRIHSVGVGSLGSTISIASDGRSVLYNPLNSAFNDLAVGSTRTETFTYTIIDGGDSGLGGAELESNVATVTVTVHGTNDAPEAQDDAATTDEDTAVSVAVLDDNGNGPDTDTDVGDTFSVTDAQFASGQSLSTATVTTDGTTVTFDPGSDFDYLAPGETAEAVIEYTITDLNGLSDTATLTVTVTGVNDAPLAGDGTATTDEDTELLDGDLTALVSDVDNVLADLSFSEVSPPAKGILTVNADGSYTFDPNGEFESLAVGESEDVTFTYSVSDGVLSDTGTVTITVTGVNDAPIAYDDSFSTDEDTPSADVDLTTNDFDIDTSDTLSVVAIEGQAIAPGGEVTLSSGEIVRMNLDGTLVFDPNGQHESLPVLGNALVEFEYTVSDGLAEDTATASVTVDGVNDAPVLQAVNGITATTDEENPVDFPSLTDQNGDPVATDVDTALLFVSLIDDSLTEGTIEYNATTGMFTYTPDPSLDLGVGETASDYFSYTVSDGRGGTVEVEAFITITDVNLPPVAVDDIGNPLYATDEETPLSVGAADGVLDNDTDPDTGDTLVVAEVNGESADVGQLITLPSGATLMLNADGSFDYNPVGAFDHLAEGEIGTDTFTYNIVDRGGAGLMAPTPATVEIEITGVNDAPVAADDSVAALEDGGDFDFTTTLLSNDSDVDSDDDSSTLTIVDFTGPVLVAEPAGYPAGTFAGQTGTLRIEDVSAPSDPSDFRLIYNTDGDFQELADADQVELSFTYTIRDAHGAETTATATLIVDGDNDVPVALGDSVSGTEDTELPISAAFLLSNDSDIDFGDTLSIVSFSQPVNGTVTQDGNGDLLYTPDPDTNGSDAFTYTVADELGATATAIVSVWIEPVGDAPDTVADTATTDEDVAVAITVLTNDTDVDDAIDVDTVVVTSGPSNGSVSVDSAGVVTYTPNADFNGTDSFEYTVDDESGNTSLPATVTITVNAVNDAPIANDDSDSTGVAQPVDIAVLANDTDVDGDTLMVDSATDGSNGSVVINPDGTVTYTPNAGFQGVDEFMYTITDGSLTDTATVTVTVADLIGPSVVADNGLRVSSQDWHDDFLAFVDPSLELGYSPSDGEAPLPWINLDQIHLTFSEDVQRVGGGDILLSDIQIVGVAVADYTPLITSFSYDDTTFTLSIELRDTIGADRLEVLIDGSSLTDNAGNAFEGDTSFRFDVLPGNATRTTTGTNAVTGADLLAIRSAQGTETADGPSVFDPILDINGTGEVTGSDYTEARIRQFNQLPTGTPAPLVFAPIVAASAVSESEDTTAPSSDPAIAMLLAPTEPASAAVGGTSASRAESAATGPNDDLLLLQAAFESPEEDEIEEVEFGSTSDDDSTESVDDALAQLFAF